MSDAADKAVGDEYARSELVDAFSSVHINVHGDAHGNVQSNAPHATANCKSQSSESTASAGSDQFAGDETAKREQFERNFLQLKTTCSTFFEKFATRINNYYIVTKTGIHSSRGSNPRDERSPTARSAANQNHLPVLNCNRSNVSSSLSSNPLLPPNSHSPQDFITSNVNHNSATIQSPADSGAITNSTQPPLNRNLVVRRSSRSNLGSANESVGQQFKMTRDQLSPTVNAQCLSPRPRPKELNMGAPSLKKSSQQSPIGLLNSSLETRHNSIRIDGKDYAIDESDFRYIEQLGAGTCGTVNKMEHIRSKAIVAVKEMTRSSHPEDNKRINMDLEVLLNCNQVAHIVQCYGYLIKGTRVWIVMELMTTCLDKLLKKINSPFPEPICGKIAVASIKSLDYLKTQHAVIHRDPSNILINTEGEIKLCDFGVSGHLVDSYAKTKQGCEAYMAPERILPPDPKRPSYDIRADVWSLGITLVQLALGRYPYQNCRGDFELLTKIIESDPPTLPENSNFSDYFRDFINLCLQKDVEKRPKYKYLKWDPFYLKSDRDKVDVKEWFNKVWSS